MKMPTMNYVICGTAMLSAGIAVANDRAVRTNFRSAAIVSPAQLSEIEIGRADGGVTFNFSKAEMGDTKAEQNTYDVGVTGLYGIGATDLKLGLDAGIATGSGSLEDADGDLDRELSGHRISPIAIYTVNNVVVAAQYVHNWEEQKFKGVLEAEGDAGQFIGAAMYQTDRFEAGLVYRSAMKTKFDVTSEIEGIEFEGAEEETPDAFVLHGRTWVSDTLRVGAAYENARYSSIKDVDMKDAHSFLVTSELNAGRALFTGGVGYQTAYYDNDEDASEENIDLMMLTASVDYAVMDRASLGGGLSYAFGEEDIAGETLKASNLGVELRGNWVF